MRTDAAGRFSFEHLDPGRLTVSVMPSQEEIMRKVSETQDQTAIMDLFGNMITETVELEDGEETHVVLGQKAKDPVRIFGRVSEAGSSVEEVQVIAIVDGGGGSLLEGMKAAQTDADGNYEIQVDRPGAYILNVQHQNSGSGIQFFVDIPEASEVRRDLELPTGRIEGIVKNSEGSPAPGVSVGLSRSGGMLSMEGFGRTSQTLTKSDGTFSFENLRPADYRITAGGTSFFGTESRYASHVMSGITVEKDRTTGGIEIRLEIPGKLEGTVLDSSGNPLSNASLHVRKADGQVLSAVSSSVTDAAGRFTYEGLPPGELTVTARTQDAVSAKSTSVRITSDATTTTELRVDPGTYLIVELLDDGEPVRARLQVIDEEGHEVANLVSMEELEKLFTGGISTKTRRVGPVAPGKYKLFATSLDGKEAKKTVRIRAGSDEQKVKLRLKE